MALEHNIVRPLILIEVGNGKALPAPIEDDGEDDGDDPNGYEE